MAAHARRSLAGALGKLRLNDVKPTPISLARWQLPLLLVMFYAAFCSLALMRPLVRSAVPWLGTLGELSAFFVWPYPFLLSVQKWWPQTNTGWWAAYVLGLGLVVAAGWVLQALWRPSRIGGWRLCMCAAWFWLVPLVLWQGAWWGVATALGWPTGE